MNAALPTLNDETHIRYVPCTSECSMTGGDAKAYAECFTSDANYIIANGILEKGWKGIVGGHAIIFSAWSRNSHLVGKIHTIRFLAHWEV